MSEKARRDVFQAIADPTRRRIIELVKHKPMNVVTIAEELDMTQPAISQQLKILSECGILEVEVSGRERLCKVQPTSLIPAFMWLDQFKQEWTDRIESFEQYVNKLNERNE